MKAIVGTANNAPIQHDTFKFVSMLLKKEYGRTFGDNMKQHIILILSAAYMFLPAATAAAEHAADTYEKLSGLVGDWKKADSSNSELIIRFEPTAGGTVLMERWMYGEKTIP